ncbi:unnamed protein product [Onchocerca flexuosa]|uniref:BPI2 domain-containing protein n=1 Tax=Onchocerca flexuosa TaxID=387005 RepID=A0A183I2E6_9BILA|nr:unnamed protein product [Onchocerca flexuosa]
MDGTKIMQAVAVVVKAAKSSPVLSYQFTAIIFLTRLLGNEMMLFAVDDQTISSLGPILRTSCTSRFCFADLILQLAEQYPNSKIRLVFAPTRAPAVSFQAKQGDHIN